MQTTENYGLNLFEGSDHVLAENFNANTEILDAELGKRLHSVSYTYTGNGEYTNTLTFDSPPLFLVIAQSGSDTTDFMGFAAYGNNRMPVSDGTSSRVGYQICVWNGNSLTLHSADTERIFNQNGATYRVTALLP